MTIRWRRHTELPAPDAPVFTALLARRDSDGAFLVDGIFEWKRGRFLNEAAGKPFLRGEFWWLPESELTDLIPLR